MVMANISISSDNNDNSSSRAIGDGGEAGTVVQLPAPHPPNPTPAPAPELAATFSSGASTAPVSNVIPPNTRNAGTVAMAVAGRNADDSTPTRSAPVDGVVASERVDVQKTIARRSEGREERRRELLLEARAARVEWILDDGVRTLRGEELTDDGGNGPAAGPTSGPMGRLRACRPDILPCAPGIVERMLSSSGPHSLDRRRLPARGAAIGMLNAALEDQGLSWEDVSGPSTGKGENERKEEETSSSEGATPGGRHPSLDLPHVPDPVRYNAFLHALCEPPAADLVMSIQKFCRTIAEAAGVMVSSIEDDGGDGIGGDPKEAEINATDSVPGESASSRRQSLSHGASLAKAVRGFLNTTMREIEVHLAFHELLHTKRKASGTSDATDGEEEIDPDIKEQILASLERFVYSKCRSDADAVLLAGKEISSDTSFEGVTPSTATMREFEAKLHEKMMSLQFVTPSHLEIQCLKSCGEDDIDLSYSISQLRSMCDLASPRQMLRAILLAHRGITVALDKACGGAKSPGADDILPTLILAVLRAHPRNLSTALRFVEHFAPLSLLRGEAGYAYTNLCGAMQFLRELDMEGHAAEVALGVAGEGAVLSIGPEEFRAGLEACRRTMNNEECERISRRCKEEGVEADDPAAPEVIDEECAVVTPSPELRIAARDVREALFRGEVVDLEWALQKQRKPVPSQSGASGADTVRPPWSEGGTPAAALTVPDELRATVPPEEPPLPSRFSRSYPFLVARPEDIGLCDLPVLLRDYKMLVHATEKLLDERAVWRESERKRQLRLEREYLERGFNDVIGTGDDENVTQVNGY